MTHETNDPPRKRERPAEGSTIVRLAMDWRHWERRAQGATSVGAVYGFDQRLAAEALDALRAAVDTRL